MYEPYVRVRFYRPRDWFGRLISWISGSAFSHCNIEVDGEVFDLPFLGRGRWCDTAAIDAFCPPDETIFIRPLGWKMTPVDYFPFSGARIPILKNIVHWVMGLPAPLNCATMVAGVLAELGFGSRPVWTPDDLHEKLFRCSPETPSYFIHQTVHEQPPRDRR